MTHKVAYLPEQSTRRRRSWSLFVFLVVGVAVTSSNIGQINNRLGIGLSSGENLIGPRDILVLLTLILGVLQILHRRVVIFPARLALFPLLIVLLTPIAAILGWIEGGESLTIVREFVVMLNWLLVIIVGASLRDIKDLQALFRVMLILGVLAAVGILVESWSNGAILIVTPDSDVAFDRLFQSTPPGVAVLIISAALCFVTAIARNQRRSTTYLALGGFGLIIVAMMLTQSRTLIFSVVIGILAVLLFLVGSKSRRMNPSGIVRAIVVLFVAFGLAILFGDRLMGDTFSSVIGARYQLFGSTTDVAYVSINARLFEIEHGFQRFLQSPIFGIGLGSPYRPPLIENGVFWYSTQIHNVFAFFLFRYGLIGLLLFLYFAYQIAITLRRALQDNSESAILGVGFSLATVMVLLASIAGNQVGSTSTYGLPPTAVVVGCMIAYQRLRGSDTIHPTDMRAHRSRKHTTI